MLRREFLMDMSNLTFGARACYESLAEPQGLPSDTISDVIRAAVEPHYAWQGDADAAVARALKASDAGWLNIGVWVNGGLVGINPQTGRVDFLP